MAAAAPPLAQLAREIGGEQLRVTDLTPAGGQPHDLQLSAPANAALQRARAVLYLGGGFQPKVEEAIGRLPKETERVDLLGGATLEYPAPLDGIAGVPPLTAGAVDPHVWLDPPRYAELAKRTGEALAGADGDHAEGYRQRAAAMASGTRQLDAEYRSGLSGCTGLIVATHPAWGYVAKRYGLTAHWVGGISPAAAPPKATIEALRREARAGAKALVVATPLPSRTTKAITAQTGLKVVVADPLEGGGSPPYLTAMRSNLQALATAAGCSGAPAAGEEPASTTTPQ